MGHCNRKSSGSLVYQVQTVFDGMLAIGDSKYQAKRSGCSYAHIYSWNTYRAYLKHACYFVNWCKRTYGCKTVADCQPHVADWMQTRRDLSAYTQKLDLSALAKLYQCKTEDFNVTTPSRKRADIRRSRGPVKRDAHFNEDLHKELVSFCRSTGLRRAELKALRGTALYQDEHGQFFLHVTSGTKGGKDRYAPIVGDVELVRRLCTDAGSEKVFANIPSAADIHSYRADYANRVYHKYARPISELSRKQIYSCRRDRKGVLLDKAAMRIASNALGHNRISVIAGHYLHDFN